MFNKIKIIEDIYLAELKSIYKSSYKSIYDDYYIPFKNSLKSFINKI